MLGFVDLLAKDGITLLQTDKYGQGLLQTQKNNYAPRIGLAYTISPKWVARGGFGLFFNSFENQGYGPNIGENYPFVFNLSYFPSVASGIASQVAPTSYNTPFNGCATAGPGGTASFESGFSCIPLTPTAVNANGLGLQGLQFDYQTPSTQSANFTLQYSITHTLSATASYVYTHGANLQGGVGYQNVGQFLPAGTSTKPYIPFADFGGGSYQATYGQSSYHGLQTKLEKQMSGGLTFLLTYTWSKTMSNAGDLLNGGTTGSLRAYAVPGLGPKFDLAPADFDIRQVVHFSGAYELPFGKDKKFMHQGGPADLVLGGWAMNWIAVLQGGQPLNIGCISGTTSGLGCNAIRCGDAKLGIKKETPATGYTGPYWIGNAAAFTQPCQLGGTVANPVPNPGSPAGCVPVTGAGVLGSKAGQIPGPGFHRLDFSLFKGFQLSDRFSLQFRSEFFNILNHPNFNAPCLRRERCGIGWRFGFLQ